MRRQNGNLLVPDFSVIIVRETVICIPTLLSTVFRATTGTKKNIFPTMIATYGTKRNEYYLGRIQAEVLMEDLFK